MNISPNEVVKEEDVMEVIESSLMENDSLELDTTIIKMAVEFFLKFWP